MEIKVGFFLKKHIDKIINMCRENKTILDNLLNKDYSNRTFGLNSSFSLIEKLSVINERKISVRYYKKDYVINDDKYRVCSQFGGNHQIEGKNASVYHGEMLLNYFKQHNLLDEEFQDQEIKFIVGDVKSSIIKNKLISVVENKLALNQILYGPPGTGKTYNTINRALEIIDGEVPEDRSEAKKRFEELSSVGQIEFVTFHQSYGYEEFVEGIKASTIDGNIFYDIESGIFRLNEKYGCQNNYLFL